MRYNKAQLFSLAYGGLAGVLVEKNGASYVRAWASGGQAWASGGRSEFLQAGMWPLEARLGPPEVGLDHQRYASVGSFTQGNIQSLQLNLI